MQQIFYATEETEAGWRGEDSQRTCTDVGTHALDLCRYFFDEDPALDRRPDAGGRQSTAP